MDIDKLYTADAHEEGAEMQVKDFNGKEIDCWIKVVGVDSKKFRNESLTLKRNLVKNDDVDVEAVKAESLANVTLDWRGFESKGKELPFSQKAVKKLYEDAPYIMDQVDRFISKRANFTKG